MLTPSQLTWRCRRGIRELDVLLTRFLSSSYAELNEFERQDFERFLEVQDPEIMDCLFGKSRFDDAGVQGIVERLQALSGI